MDPKPKRVKDRRLLDEIKKQPCIICGQRPSDPDHVVTRGAGGEDSERNVWPLCRRHHTERHTLGLRRLAHKYSAAMEALQKRGFTDIVKEAKEIEAGQLDLPIK